MSYLDSFDKPFTFSLRPTPLTGDLRPAWRMALVLTMLLHSRGRKASVRKLHALNTACRSLASSDSFLNYLRAGAVTMPILPRLEPSLNRAVNLLRGESLVEIENGRNIKLTARGLDSAKRLGEMTDCLERERAFLVEAGPMATEAKVERLFDWGSHQ